MHDEIVAVVARVRAGVGGARWPRSATACSLAEPAADQPRRRDRAPAGHRANAYDLRLVVSRKLYDAGVAVAAVAVAGRRWPRAARLHLHPLDLDRLGATDGHRAEGVERPQASLVLEVEADAGRARGHGLAAVQPARRRRAGDAARRRPRPSSTSGSRTWQ